MGLSKVWVQTVADGLVRADSIIGITTHPTPAIAGKPSRWLLDIVLSTTTGSGSAGSWISNPLHRTLAQTDHPAANAPTELASMLARLDSSEAAGVITVERVPGEGGTAVVQFRFTPFSGPDHVNSTSMHTTSGRQGDRADPPTL